MQNLTDPHRLQATSGVVVKRAVRRHVRYLCGCLMVLICLGTAPLSAADEFEEGMTALQAEDYRAASRLFKRMAMRDHVEAQYQLGLLYLAGQGVAQDVDQGVDWLKRAAEGGSYKAANELSQIYLSGKGLPRDETEAVKWLELATRIAGQNAGEADDGCE
ncbi:MAG: tetratricopeptide repeat protein [Candidatus Thiodiazotropha sp.]